MWTWFTRSNCVNGYLKYQAMYMEQLCPLVNHFPIHTENIYCMRGMCVCASFWVCCVFWQIMCPGVRVHFSCGQIEVRCCHVISVWWWMFWRCLGIFSSHGISNVQLLSFSGLTLATQVICSQCPHARLTLLCTMKRRRLTLDLLVRSMYINLCK